MTLVLTKQPNGFGRRPPRAPANCSSTLRAHLPIPESRSKHIIYIQIPCQLREESKSTKRSSTELSIQTKQLADASRRHSTSFLESAQLCRLDQTSKIIARPSSKTIPFAERYMCPPSGTPVRRGIRPAVSNPRRPTLREQ